MTRNNDPFTRPALSFLPKTAVWPLSLADVDMDGEVGLWDFALFAGAWGATSGEPSYDPLCDISDPANGLIDTADCRCLPTTG